MKAENQLSAHNRRDADAYDPLGRRVSTTDGSGTVYHAYDGIHCVADLDGDGGILRAYTWGAGVDNLLAVTLVDGSATNTLYAVTDPLGTVHALVASDGTIAVSYAYDSWGNLLSVSGDETLIASLRFTWQGREYSHAAGLYNFRARWYDPAAGRWLSKDPIGLEGGLNLYEAFGNNPVCFGDILGESTVEIISTIGILKLSDPELPDFYDTVKSFPDNSISRLNIYDHGTRIMMNIDGFGSGVSWSGNPEDLIEFDIGLGSLLDLVRSKLVCGAIIGLFGCNTAREFSCCNNDNIARQLSRELPDVFVTGFAGFGVGNELSLWFFGCKRPFIRFGDTTFVTGIKRTYLNGIEVR